jgi:hypothetical protein
VDPGILCTVEVKVGIRVGKEGMFLTRRRYDTFSDLIKLYKLVNLQNVIMDVFVSF